MRTLVATLILFCAACGSGDATAEKSDDVRACHGTSSLDDGSRAKPASFAKDVAPILVSTCAFSSCHGVKSETNGLFLPKEPGQMRKELLAASSRARSGVKFVVPNAPDQSFLVTKITNATFCAPECEHEACGERMPRGGDPLSDDQVAAIQAWIASGANDD